MLDPLDQKILALLQKDATRSQSEIAAEVQLSTSTVSDRIRQLQNNGIIKNTVVTLYASELGLNILAFISVLIDWNKSNHSFVRVVETMPQVLECHHVTGDWSYLLKVRARDNVELEDLISNKIKSLPGVTRSETIFVLNTDKETTALPMPDFD